MEIKVAIYEDTQNDYKKIYSLLMDWQNSYHHDVSITWYQKESEILESDFDFDILFSDIEIKSNPNTLGVRTCETLRRKGYKGEIIFLTAYSEYVFDGYSVKAQGYLLKPIDAEKLERCMNHYIQLHMNDYYYLHTHDTLIQIPYNQIICINKEIHNVIIQTTRGLYTERISLSKIEKKLPSMFVRCHKSSIVNLLYVQALAGSKLHLCNGLVQEIGRSYYSNIKDMIFRLVEH